VSELADLARRVDRVESQLAIQQLAARYALAVDSRDLDTWADLFVADVDCGSYGKGREALKKFIDPAVRTFYRSHHQLCGHVIEFVDTDHAKGTVYCRAEHEAGDRWIVMAICYFDTYERRDGRWYFLRRAEKHWYSSDVLERPGEPEFQNWPAWTERKPTLPHQFPTWKRFWERTPAEELKKLSSQPWEPI
jgi:ketosteroid isomerase-like protein